MKNEKAQNNGSKTEAEISEGNPVPNSGQKISEKSSPTREDIRKWCKHDSQSAHAFLGLLLARPDILEALADMLYEDSITGPKIP